MLEIRPNCEHCGKTLPPNASDARICTYECTFCAHCVDHILMNICPNCTGGFEARPMRPQAKLEKHPAQSQAYIKPVDLELQAELIARYEKIPPENR